MKPKVSILIPCYNAEQWIAQAIQSALDQTYPNKEVIVIDDGSSDRSLEVIKSYGNQIYWESQLNQGGNTTRNRLLELSTGEWLQYLDADDYLKPDKIEKQVQFLEQHPQVDVIYSPTIYKYHDGNDSRQEIVPIPKPHDPWILLARWFLPQTGSPLWRQQALLDAGGWKTDQPCCQEHELYLRLLMAGKHFEYYPCAGSVYRQWSESTLCRKNQLETNRRRLEVVDRLEQFLEATGKLSKPRQDAINQARLECARMIWLSNRVWARELVEQIHHRNPYFIPAGDAAPLLYKMTYRAFGFSSAENIAKLKRSFLSRATK